MKNINKIFVTLFLLIALTAYVSATNLDVTSVEINNRNVYADSGNHTNNYKYERGESLDVDVCVKALDDVQDAQIEADIYGYRYSAREQDKVSDTTNTFDLNINDNDCFTLQLQIPDKIDQDYYKLRIRVGDRDGITFEKDYQLDIQGAARSDAVQIKDYSIDPQEVIAGRAFTAMIKVKNIGDYDLTDLKATISIPELNIKTSEYMNNLDADKSKTFEELLLRVPECAKKGTYDVDILVEFDEYEETTLTTSIDVVPGDMCGTSTGATTGSTGGQTPQQENSVITVPNSQELSQGTSVAYPIMIQNNNAQAKTYTLSLSGASTWATARVDPSSVIVVPAGQSRTAYLYVSANDNSELGDKVFTLTVDSGTESKQIPLVAKITKNVNTATTDWSKFRNALEIGLVILVIILIIIGLIIGFNKVKDNKQEAEPYY
jgi:uncharacterized membrane protein